MSSLREEIEDIVRNTRDFTSPKITNMIISKIEKRIDDYIRDKEEKITPLGRKTDFHEKLIWQETHPLKEFKEEMLK